MDAKTFPIQSDYRDTKVHPTRIPWEVADKAYAVYRSRYGSQQSLERLAERGGFSGGEMDMFYPGWRDEVSGIAVRDARIAELETALARVERENTLLRAECEAWRAWWDAELPIDLNKPDMYQDVACARQDTDAAGILKGAGT